MQKNTILEQLKELSDKSLWMDAQKLIEENIEIFDPGVYHFNLGFFYLKQEKFLEARVEFEKSKLLAHESLVLDNALQETTNALGVTSIESYSFLEKVELEFVEASAFTYLSLSFFFIISFAWFYKKIISRTIRIIWLLLILTPISFKFLVYPEVKPIVLKQDHFLYFGPSFAFEKMGELPVGTKLFIEEREDLKWKRILYPKSLRGWIENKDYIELE